MNAIAAILYAVASSVLAAIILAFAAGGLNPTIAGVSLSLGALVAGFAFWQSRMDAFKPRKLTGWEWGAVLLFALFSLRAFLWLVFQAQDEIKVLSPNNLGDLALHLTYIRQLANGVPFWPDNPIVANAKLTYPLGLDLFNTLLVLTGFDTFRGLICVGLAGSVLTGLALWRWGGAFALTGFLCNGGIAGFAALRTGELLDYQSELAWKSIPLALFVTQRGLLFALPAGLLLLCSWRARFFPPSGKSRTPGKPLPLAGEVLLYAAMPVFHFHTFLFLSLVLLIWFIWRSELRLSLARFVLISLIPASLLVLLVTANLHGPSVLSWHVGWMLDDEGFLKMCRDQFGTQSKWLTIPYFWFLNFGVLPFFVGGLIVALVRERRRWSIAAAVPALAAFALCCLISFAPWAWDNTKLIIWSYLVLLPLLWTHLIGRWPAWLRALACFALFWSGFASLLGGLGGGQTGFSIAIRSELDLLAPAVRDIPATERFIAHPNYNHPLLLLGHPLVLGYTGHVYSHGYPWQEPLATVESILNGEEGWRERALATRAHYLFWGAQEREAYENSTQPWRESATLVAQGEWGEIYDLNSPAESAQQTPPQVSVR